MFGTPFEIFGTVHVITIVVIAFVSIFLPKFYKGKADEQISLMKKIIAGVIAAHVIISPYKDLYLLANPYDWRETIPLHMCDLSEIFLLKSKDHYQGIMITITHVLISKDLSVAKVYLSIFPDSNKQNLFNEINVQKKDEVFVVSYDKDNFFYKDDTLYLTVN